MTSIDTALKCVKFKEKLFSNHKSYRLKLYGQKFKNTIVMNIEQPNIQVPTTPKPDMLLPKPQSYPKKSTIIPIHNLYIDKHVSKDHTVNFPCINNYLLTPN